MKAALVTPFLNHIPLHPGTFLGYGTAILKEKYDLTVIDLNAQIYLKNKAGFLEVLSHIDKKQVVLDNMDFYPFYLELENGAERAYSEISWSDFETVFITTPSWFVTIPSELVLKLSEAIKRQSPHAEISFFGNSLGTWTDEKILKDNGVGIRNINNLFDANSSFGPVDYDTLPTPVYPELDHYLFKMFPFRMKHGCIWGKCRFCSLAKGWNAGYLERSTHSVLQELEELIDIYNPKMLICTDNTLNGKNLIEFCRGFEGFHMPWGGMARAELTRKEIKALQRAGCRLIYFGLESGSDRVLNHINKGISTRQMSDFMKILHDYNIFSAPSLFVGAPGETEADFEETIQFIRDHVSHIGTLNLFPLMITPSSDFYTQKVQGHDQTLDRLFKLIKVCSDAGITACVGEQSDEYMIFRKVYEGDLNY